MQSLFFGSSSRKLFGEIYPASGSSAGAIICGSWGPEAQASDRFLSALARRIARNGIAVMKFDYFGCGDSYGDGAETTMANMVESCEWAIEEFVDSQVLTTICILGFRLGAPIALRAHSPTNSCLTLVDPVLNGNDWLCAVESNDSISVSREDNFLEIGGFPMGQVLEDELKTLEREQSVPEHAGVSSIVWSSKTEQVEITADNTILCEADPSWILTGGVGLASIPSKLIDAIVDELTNCTRT